MLCVCTGVAPARHGLQESKSYDSRLQTGTYVRTYVYCYNTPCYYGDRQGCNNYSTLNHTTYRDCGNYNSIGFRPFSKVYATSFFQCKSGGISLSFAFLFVSHPPPPPKYRWKHCALIRGYRLNSPSVTPTSCPPRSILTGSPHWQCLVGSMELTPRWEKIGTPWTFSCYGNTF